MQMGRELKILLNGWTVRRASSASEHLLFSKISSRDVIYDAWFSATGGKFVNWKIEVKETHTFKMMAFYYYWLLLSDFCRESYLPRIPGKREGAAATDVFLSKKRNDKNAPCASSILPSKHHLRLPTIFTFCGGTNRRKLILQLAIFRMFKPQ